jgi:hypothetical protein
MSGTPWNTTDTERLRTLASSGLSVPEIANEMERSKNAIRAWAEKLNIGIVRSRSQGNFKGNLKPHGSGTSGRSQRRRGPDGMVNEDRSGA